MERSIDKLNETAYHYNRLKSLLDELIIEKNGEKLVLLIQNFRFELNAYVNSHRATTFTLQSELRNKFGDFFENWYSKKKEILKGHPFGKTLLELRNINQKEGNLYPTFLIKRESGLMIYIHEFDLIDSKRRFLKPYNFLPKSNKITFDLPQKGIGENPNELTEQEESFLKFQLFKTIKEDLESIKNEKSFEVFKIRIERFNNEYTPSQFLNNLKEMGILLEDLILEGVELFKDIKKPPC
jgi:hypothetical protein